MIHPSTYIIFFFGAIAGMFKEFLIIFIIVITHEFGHYIIAKLFKWNISKINIYPFGGCIKFDEKINKSFFEEFMILIGGPFMQFIIFIIVCILFKNHAISYKTYIIFKNYNLVILIFNLLPIYPLDGGKALNIVFNYYFSYTIGNLLTIFISFIILVTLISCFNLLEYNYILISFILITEMFIYYKNQNYLYNKLLLEKYLFYYEFKKIKVVKPNGFYKNKRHVIKEKNKYFTEREYLKYRYKQ